MRATNSTCKERVLLRSFALLVIFGCSLVFLSGTATAAVIATELTSGASSTAGRNYTTASITPAPANLILIWVTNSRGSNPDTPSSLTGNGLTWVQVATTVSWNTIASPTRVTTLFRAMGSAPTSGAITISFGRNQTGCEWTVIQFAGADPSGTDGSGAVVQYNTGAVDSGTSLSITLPSALTYPTDATAGGFSNTINSATSITQGSGYTAFTGAANTYGSLRAEWRAAGSTTVDVTSTSSAIAGIAVEIRDGSFNYKRSITIKDAMTPGSPTCTSDLSSFPILVSQTDAMFKTVANGGHVYNPNGYDIIFTDANRVQLDHEIEQYDGLNGVIVAWVRVPTVKYNGDTTIYMYYSNPAVTAVTANPAGVWGTSHKAVWHLNNATAATVTDSTTTPDNGTPQASPPQTAGKIDGSLSFNGSTQYVLVNNSADLQLAPPFTVSAWVKTSSTDTQSRLIVAKWRTGQTPAARNYWFGKYWTGSANVLRFYGNATQYAEFAWAGPPNIADDAWHHVVGVAGASTLTLYIDGAQQTPVAFSGVSENTGTSALHIASSPDAAGQIWSGGLDEVRLSSSARDACWIGTESNSVTYSSNPSYLEMSAEGLAGPTAVELVSLGATFYPGQGVLVSWQTGWEVDNLGFHVYREQGGERVRVTPNLVAGSALLAGAGTELRAGQSYGWWDDPGPVVAAPVYWLEEWELNGTRRWHGPVNVQAALPSDPAPRVRRPVRLPGLGASATGTIREGPLADPDDTNASSAASASSAGTRLATSAAASADGVSRALPRRRLAPIESQLAVAGQSVVKLGVERTGWVRVGRDELVAAGLDPSVDPRWLQLYTDGIEVPIRVVGEEDGILSSGDALEWYGQALDTPSTDTRVYYLVAAGAWGQRIPTEVVAGGGGGPTSFPYEVVREDNTLYFSALKNGEADNFFGAVIAANVVGQALPVHHLDRAGEAELVVRLQGASAEWHRVHVSVSGASIGEINWQGLGVGEGRFAIPASLLREPETAVALEPLGGEGDISLVDRIALKYAHTYQADSWALTFTVPGGAGIAMSGFWRGPVRVMDVTDPGHPVELAGPYAGPNLSLLVPGQGTRTVVASSESKMAAPAWVRPDHPSALWAAQGADLVIIGPGAFLPAVVPLVELRQSEGLSVLVADIEDVVDEFAAGAWGPAALQAFLKHATSEWSRPPRYVLLVGDSTLDPRDYLGFGDQDFVPTVLVETEYIETASDTALADTDGDGLADLAVGRLPVASLNEAQTVVAKLVQYGRQTTGGNVVLVADANDQYNDFEGTTRSVLGAVPRTQPVKMFQRGYLGSEKTRTLLYEELQRGAMLVNYLGHGSVQQWAGDVLTVDGLRSLSSNRLPIVVAMTCLHSYFLNPSLDSLGEAMLATPAGGAAAVWASTGLTESEPQALMDVAFVQSWFAGTPSPRLGDLILAATAATDDPDVRATWVLLGDPTMRVH